MIAPESGRKDAHTLGALNLATYEKRTVALGFLAHSVVPHPLAPHLVVAVGQRPGRESALVDLREARVVSRLKASGEHHFYGHGLFSPRGDLLFMTEHHQPTGEGRITVRDTTSYALKGELKSHGAAPHELHPILVGGRRAFAIGNGGPDEERGYGAKGHPALTYVDAESGALLESLEISDKSLSLRHLAITADNSLALAMRSEARDHSAPCVAFRYRGGPLRQGSLSSTEWAELGGHALSVALLERGTQLVAAMTHPEANRVSLWDVQEAALLAHHAVNGVQGVSLNPSGSHWLFTGRGGELHTWSTQRPALSPVKLPRPIGLDWKHSLQLRFA